MAQIKSQRNLSTEQRLLHVMRTNGITGWRRNYPVFGKPDFVFPAAKIAVFVDGCFWHGHPERCRLPKTNHEYWQRKIQRNMRRDKEVNRVLKSKGWRVMRVWEHKVDDVRTVSRLRRLLAHAEK